MICGTSSLPWSIFMKGYLAAEWAVLDAAEHLGKANERWSQVRSLYELRRPYHSPIDSKGIRFSNMGLGTVLRWTKEFHTTDPRDKIYGSLGLLSMSEREMMNPDYRKPTELVFLEATQHILEHKSSPSFSRFSFSPSGKSLSIASPSWVPDFSAQKGLSPGSPNIMTVAPGSKKPTAHTNTKLVSFQDHDRVLAITGVLFDTIEIAVELKNKQELLLSQILELEHLIQLAVEKRIPPDDPLYSFGKFKKHEDIFQVLTAGRGSFSGSAPSLREQYGALTGRATASSLGSGMAPGLTKDLLWLIKHFFSGRCFFVTKMGFFGVAVAKFRKNDNIEFLVGERAPIILRPRGLSYSMVGAAYVSGVMVDEVTGDMYERGLIEKRTS